MKILVMGGTYFLGKRVVEKLIKKNYNVTLLNRGTRGSIFRGVENIITDRHNFNKIKRKLDGKNFDVIIDFSAYNQDDVKTILDCLGKRIKQYIFLSSAAVYSRPYKHCPVREKHPKCSFKDRGCYGYNKLMAEKLLLNRSKVDGFHVSIIRITYAYGPGDYSRRFSYIFEKITSDKPIIVSNGGKNIVQLCYVDDLADAIIKIINSPKTHEGILNVGSEELFTVKQIIKAISDVLKIKSNIIFVGNNHNKNSEICSLPNFNYFIDVSKAKKLGIVSKTALKKGIKSTLDNWKKQEAINNSI